MLNEERVKHMVKLAAYENKHGEEEIKTQTNKKKDYVKVQVYISCIWVTAGYICLLALLGIGFSQQVIPYLSVSNALIAFVIALLLYIAILLRYIIFAWPHYTKKYDTAKEHVEQYMDDLELLESLYEKEEA